MVRVIRSDVKQNKIVKKNDILSKSNQFLNINYLRKRNEMPHFFTHSGLNNMMASFSGYTRNTLCIKKKDTKSYNRFFKDLIKTTWFWAGFLISILFAPFINTTWFPQINKKYGIETILNLHLLFRKLKLEHNKITK